MRSIFVTLLLFAHATETDAANLRIATFNINWGNPNLPDIRRTIQTANAHLVCIQESTAASERYLRATFRDTYPHIQFVGHKGKYGAERFGFMSKLPLKHLEYVPPAHGLFGTYFAGIEHDGRSIHVANVHLSPFTVPRSAGVLRALQSLSDAEAVHRKEVAALAAEIQPKKHILVCGDFNSISSLAAPKHLASLGLVDSFASVTKDADRHFTWRWPVGKTHIQFRIDYIFHSEHFTTVASQIIPTTGSDHFLVVTEVTTDPPKETDAAEDGAKKSDLRVSRLTYHTVPILSIPEGPPKALLFGLIQEQNVKQVEDAIPHSIKGRNGSASIAESESKLVGTVFYFRGVVERSALRNACKFVGPSLFGDVLDHDVHIVFTRPDGKKIETPGKLVVSHAIMNQTNDEISNEYHSVWPSK